LYRPHRPAGFAKSALAIRRIIYARPTAAPTPAHHVRIFRLAEAAVVATERAVEVALLDVEVVAQDGAAKTQVGPHVEEVAVLLADQPNPEGHHLHVAARAGGRHGVLLETAFDLDQAEHHLRIETGALGFVIHGLEKIEAPFAIRHATRKPAGHFGQPVDLFLDRGELRLGRGAIGDRRVQRRLHAGRQRFVLLGTRLRRQRQ
jgi:hypothetical protein